MDGRARALEIRKDLKQKIQSYCKKHQAVAPGLKVILIGNNPASLAYIRQKIKSAEEVGLKAKTLHFREDTKLENIKTKIEELNQDPETQGILLQLPLPKKFSAHKIISWINPLKDPDCLSPENQGLLFAGYPRVKPCTPQGVMDLLEHYKIPLAGKKAVVLGRSLIVGRPMFHLLLKANASVSICHSYTKDLSYFTRLADVVVSAVGRSGFLGKNDLKKGAVAIDVGITRETEGGLKGDLRFEELKGFSAFATPVPGGVGPMTVAMLLKNTFELALLQKK